MVDLTTLPGTLRERILAKVASQYEEDDPAIQVLGGLCDLVAEIETVIATMDQHFVLDTAVGEQLTFIGTRIGWPRTHCDAIEVLSFGFQRANSFTDITDNTNFTGTNLTWDSDNGYWVPNSFSGSSTQTLTLNRSVDAQPHSVKINIDGNPVAGKELSELRVITTSGNTNTVDLTGSSSANVSVEPTYNDASDFFDRIEIDYVPDDSGYFKVTQISLEGDGDAEPACVDANVGDFCVSNWACGGAVGGPTIADYTFTDDELYRKFIKAKLVRNRSNGNITKLIEAADHIFGAGETYIHANGDGTVTLGLNRALTELEDSLMPLYTRALPVMRGVTLAFHNGPNTDQCT